MRWKIVPDTREGNRKRSIAICRMRDTAIENDHKFHLVGVYSRRMTPSPQSNFGVNNIFNIMRHVSETEVRFHYSSSGDW